MSKGGGRDSEIHLHRLMEETMQMRREVGRRRRRRWRRRRRRKG